MHNIWLVAYYLSNWSPKVFDFPQSCVGLGLHGFIGMHKVFRAALCRGHVDFQQDIAGYLQAEHVLFSSAECRRTLQVFRRCPTIVDLLGTVLFRELAQP